MTVETNLPFKWHVVQSDTSEHIAWFYSYDYARRTAISQAAELGVAVSIIRMAR